MKTLRLPPRLAVLLPLAFLLLGHSRTCAQDVTWFVKGDTWNYFPFESGAGSGNAPPDIGGKTWKEVGYDDSGWDMGPGELGFNEGDEATLLNRGAITYYFRKTITVTQAQLDMANQLKMLVVRDDGIVVYVNGTEIFRDNMAGDIGDPVAHGDLALSAVAGADEDEPLEQNFLSDMVFDPGENTIAVEVHQNQAGSSDISFWMSMLGFEVIPVLGFYTPPAPINFELPSRGVNPAEWSPIFDFPDDPFELGFFCTQQSTDCFVDLFHSRINEPLLGFSFEQCMFVNRGSVTMVTDIEGTDHIDAPLMEDPEPPKEVVGAFRVNLSNYQNATFQFDLRAYDHAGTGMGTSERAQVTMFTSVDGDSFTETEVLNITGGGAAAGQVDTLVAEGDTKKVHVPTSNIGNTWKNLGFNDASWITGTKGVGYERSSGYDPFIGGPALDVESQMYNRMESVYMRIPFDVPDKDAYTIGLVLCMLFDDGFVAYINGSEVARRNSPGGTPAWNAGASASNPDGSATQWANIDIKQHRDKLVNGPNILAIHGLNRGTGSSDMLINAELKGIKSGNGGNVGNPESLDDIAGPIDGPFHTFIYDIPDGAQTAHFKWVLAANRGENALMLDNILIEGDPLTVQSYIDYILLTTDFELDDLGAPGADPDGDLCPNLLEYAFGGSVTVPDDDLMPELDFIDIDGFTHAALTWKQLNRTASGNLGGLPGGTGGFIVRDIKYVPQFSTDGQFWIDADPGPRVARLVGDELPEGEGDTIDVQAFFIDPVTAADERIYYRLKVILIPR